MRLPNRSGVQLKPAPGRPGPTLPVKGNQLPKHVAPSKPKPPQPSSRVLQTKLSAYPHKTIQARGANTAGPSSGRPGQLRNGVIQRALEIKSGEMKELPDVPIRRMRSQIVEIKGQRVNERGFFFTPRFSTRDIVDRLFAAFLGLGLGYEIGAGAAEMVLGNHSMAKSLRPHERMREAFGGNCIALANAFATVLDEAGITAQAVEVRRERARKAFVVRCPQFIDTEVRGHIYQADTLWASHYLFTNHTAVWVPALNLFYDPMAGTTYRNLNEKIVMELDGVGASGNVWIGRYQGREYTLTRRLDVAPGAGQFSRYDMALVPLPPPPPLPPASPGQIATPLGNFKVSNGS